VLVDVTVDSTDFEHRLAEEMPTLANPMRRYRGG
jgi:hypothetical protein